MRDHEINKNVGTYLLRNLVFMPMNPDLEVLPLSPIAVSISGEYGFIERNY